MIDLGDARGDLPPYTGTLEPEHLAAVHAERDRWLRIGLSTTPADRPAAATAVAAAYATADLEPPGVVVWMDSPLGGGLADGALRWLEVKISRQLRDRLGGQLRGQLARQLHDQLGDRLWTRLRDQLHDQLVDPLWDRLANQLGTQLLMGQLDCQPGDRFEDQLWAQLEGRLHDQHLQQLRQLRLDHFRRRRLDQFDFSGQLNPWYEASWLALYRCAGRIAGLPAVLRLEALTAAVAQLGMWWPLRGVVVLTDRPTLLARDQQGRLHAEHRPAVAWADGTALYAIHGVRVPRETIETPQTITVDQIHDEGNVEVRRVLLDRYGYARFLRDAGAERVHADDCGVLWRCPVPGEEPLVMVEVHDATPAPDGTRRAYWLRVPPEMHTARQAVAWTFDLDEHDYGPAAQT